MSLGVMLPAVLKTTMTWLVRASARSFFIAGSEATQRGFVCSLQIGWTKSSNKSAVVCGSTVTDFSSGGGGAVILAQSSITVPARAETVAVLIAATDTATAADRADEVSFMLFPL